MAQNNHKKDSYKIDVDPTTRIENNAILGFEITTTVELGKEFNKFLRTAFPDQSGFAFDLNQYGQYQTGSVFFKANESGKNVVSLFEDKFSNNGQKLTPMQMVANHNMRIQSKKFRLTDETRNQLDEFVVRNNMNKPPNWKSAEIEISEKSPLYQSAGYVYIKVSNISIPMLLKKTRGDRNDKGERLEYQVSLIAPVNNYVSLVKVDWLNVNLLNELVAKVGIPQDTSMIPMIRESL